MSDLISREFMKSIGGTCIAQRLKDGDLCPIISIDLLPSAEPEYKELQDWKTDFKGFIDALDMPRDDYCGIMEYIDEVPSAEPERKCKSCRYRNLEWDDEPCDSCTMGGEGCHYKPERKKGKWTRHFDGNEWYWYCSSCKEQWYEEDLWMGGNSFPNYCPNCGSQMNGGEQDG